MKVLVTGSTGFVGSWLTKRLIDEGHTVRVLVRNKDTNLVGTDAVLGDVTDHASVLRACSGVDTVFHLAGVIGYSKAMRPTMDTVNIEGTRNVINACEQALCSKLIYMSSVVAIGASFDGKVPLNETANFNLHHLNLGYFETKHKAELLVQDAVKTRGLHAAILNPSTIYGPGDAKKGSRNTQLKVARGKFPFYTSGGVNIIHIDDAIEAILTAWSKAKSGERYILSGENITIKILFEIIAKYAGVKPPAVYLPNSVVLGIGRIGDFMEKIGQKGPINSENAWASILYHWFDNTKAKNELNLKSRPAEESIAASVQWIRNAGLI